MTKFFVKNLQTQSIIEFEDWNNAKGFIEDMQKDLGLTKLDFYIGASDARSQDWKLLRDWFHQKEEKA